MAKWIKIETHTPGKAEIRHIARLCHCTQADAFLAFFRVFVWLDEQTEDGHVDFFTADDADDIAKLKGFGEALQEVRWIMFGPTGAVVANWDRHNGNRPSGVASMPNGNGMSACKTDTCPQRMRTI